MHTNYATQRPRDTTWDSRDVEVTQLRDMGACSRVRSAEAFPFSLVDASVHCRYTKSIRYVKMRPCLGEGGGGGGTVIPYPCKSGGIYPLSLKVPGLLSPKVLPFEFFSLIPKSISPVIPYPLINLPSYPLSLKPPLTGPRRSLRVNHV